MTNIPLEADRVLLELSIFTKQADKLRINKEFTQCLSEEINLVLKDASIKFPKALFILDENGDLIFNSIIDKEIIENTSTNFYIDLNQIIKEEANKLSKNLDSMLKENLNIVKAHAEARLDNYLQLDIDMKKRALLDKLLNGENK